MIVKSALENLDCSFDTRSNKKYFVCNEGNKCHNKPIRFRHNIHALQHLERTHKKWYKTEKEKCEKIIAEKQKQKEDMKTKRNVIENNAILSISPSLSPI
eukprot:9054_1